MTALPGRYVEAFEYEFSRLSPDAAHVDPPAVAVYETLVTRGPDGMPQPGLAESWSVAASQMSWDVVVRRNARFHSGEKADARAVADALEMLRGQIPGSRQLWYWDPVDRVEVIDRTTLRFHLHYPHPRLYTLLWGTHTAIHNEAKREQDTDAFGRDLADGTGPFELTHWSPREISATRRGKAGDAATSASWVTVESAADRYEALRSGDVQCAHALDASAVDTLAEDPRFDLARHRQPSSMYLSLDWQRTDLGFDDVNVRRAISSAIDRSQLVARALGGLGEAARGPLPPTHEFHDSTVEPFDHDPAHARALLREAGWRPGPGGLIERDGVPMSFTCVVQRDETFRAVAELVSENLREVGIAMVPQFEKPFADFYTAVREGPTAAISKWLWPDPVEALVGFTSSSTIPFPNWQRATVPALDAAFDRFLTATEDTGHRSAAKEIQAVFVESLPYVPLLTPDDVWAWRRDVRGFQPRHGDLYPLYGEVAVSPT